MQTLIVKGKEVLLDDDDYSRLKDKEWSIVNGYVCVFIDKQRYMHHYVAGFFTDGRIVHHKNYNKLDNRKENLVVTTSSFNRGHKKVARSDSKTGYRGVHRTHDGKSWTANIHLNGKRHYLGSFKHPVMAAKAYNDAAKSLHKEYACLNEV